MIKQLLVILLITSLSACSQNRSKNSSYSRNYETGNYEKGIASFYADKYQGRQTASGERFNQNAPTAAHKKLKFGTKVKVTNINNRKSVIVRINDRGPFIKGRIIDLSKSAFSAIAEQRLGVVSVTVEIVN